MSRIIRNSGPLTTAGPNSPVSYPYSRIPGFMRLRILPGTHVYVTRAFTPVSYAIIFRNFVVTQDKRVAYLKYLRNYYSKKSWYIPAYSAYFPGASGNSLPPKHRRSRVTGVLFIRKSRPLSTPVPVSNETSQIPPPLLRLRSNA